RDVWNIPFSLSAFPLLKLRGRNFDLAYTRLPLLAFLASRAGIPVAFEAHRLLPEVRWLSRRLTAGLRRSTARAAFRGFIGISHALTQWYVDRGLPSQKAIVAHDGVDLRQFTPALDRHEARRRLDLPVDRRIVGYCGHLYQGRGIDELLACAVDMPQVLFLFVGGSNGDVERYRMLAGAQRLTNTLFTGFVRQSEIPAWLFAADVLAMPYNQQTGSSWFMSPMKLFEYMAADRPIVASRFPSVCEVLRDGENAFLVEPGDPEALRNGLRRGLADPSAADM